uniref:Uncharacterized protein n=1 Tax=Oryza glumipatula TaxID=40148 RepID=A0A0D9YZX1_9ORYZ
MRGHHLCVDLVRENAWPASRLNSISIVSNMTQPGVKWSAWIQVGKELNE